ncbi:MAG: enzyme of extracellular polysaccharide biosynthesis protein [Massilia sp.]|nr:enzyme of extracellular polysaccharide biosynthesis protein [Massilia sp.]
MAVALAGAPAIGLTTYLASAVQKAQNGRPRQLTAALTTVMPIAATPVAPYYAVIFTSIRHQDGADGYGAMADLMLASAARQPGFLGVESAREEIGITVSYWASLADIARWKQDSEHLLAQRLGRDSWYDAYQVRICRVEREYGFERPPGAATPR